jgi:hypothetical protein
MKYTSKIGFSKLSADDVGTLLVITSVLLGGWFRIFPAFLAGFPVNDGGMFDVMIKDLQTNHYMLPLYTTYNNLNIPFAYPPLAFYFSAGISDLFNIPPVEIVRWLPGIVNTFCIVAFYSLAKEFLEDKLTSAAATFVYAMIPHMSEWLSMGGGLTRSFGMLFMMLTILYAHRLFTNNSPQNLWGTIVFGSLTVLSHPESIIYAIGICVFIWSIRSRTLKGFLKGVLVAVGVLLFTAPWSGLIIKRYGIVTLVTAAQTGSHSPWSPLILLNMDGITAEPYLDLLGAICILGILMLIIKKKYIIPVMLVLIYLIEPRSAHIIGIIPLAMAGGFFIAEVIVPAISKTKIVTENTIEKNSMRNAILLFAIIGPYILINSAYQGFLISRNHINETEQNALHWVKENTPAYSQFLVLTGDADAMCDSVSEWFPALTKRTSMTTLQGREWLLGNKFDEFKNKRTSIQQCINEDLSCIDRQIKYFTTSLDYVYVSNKPITNNCIPVDVSSRKTREVVTSLKTSSNYVLIYNTEDIFVFKRNK